MAILEDVPKDDPKKIFLLPHTFILLWTGGELHTDMCNTRKIVNVEEVLLGYDRKVKDQMQMFKRRLKVM